eukprot:1637956-Prymnesium_polylepis.1
MIVSHYSNHVFDPSPDLSTPDPLCTHIYHPTHSGLMAAAVQFNERFAAKFTPAAAAPTAGAWVKIAQTFTGQLAPAAQQPSGDAAYRVFIIQVPYDPSVDSHIVPGTQLRFPIVPGAEANSVMGVLPSAGQWPTEKCAFAFPVQLSKQGATSNSITINGVEIRAPPETPEAAPAVAPSAAPSAAAPAAVPATSAEAPAAEDDVVERSREEVNASPT